MNKQAPKTRPWTSGILKEIAAREETRSASVSPAMLPMNMVSMME